MSPLHFTPKQPTRNRLPSSQPRTPQNQTPTRRSRGWGKLATGNSYLSVAVIWSNTAGTVLRQDDNNYTRIDSGSWVPFTSHLMTPPTGATNVRVKLSAGHTGAVWYFDDITVSTVTTSTTSTTGVWSYPNIHGDTQAVADQTGIKQGGTFTYDPYGNPLAGTVDNQTSDYDNAWLGQHQRPLEHHAGLTPLIEMGARPYNPTLGRFLEVDPVEGGNNNDYLYPNDPTNTFDLDGLAGGGGSSCLHMPTAARMACLKRFAPTGGSGWGFLGSVARVVRAVRNAPLTAVGAGWATLNGGSCRFRSGLMLVCTGTNAWANGPQDLATLGNTVITEKPSVSTKVLNHEQAHSTQWAVLGAPGFLGLYFGSEAVSRVAGQGSCWNVLERAAPQNAAYASC